MRQVGFWNSYFQASDCMMVQACPEYGVQDELNLLGHLAQLAEACFPTRRVDWRCTVVVTCFHIDMKADFTRHVELIGVWLQFV